MKWICNMALFLMLSGILLELISDTRYYKFARWVTGVIFLMQMLRPFAETGEIWERFASVFSSFHYAVSSDRVVEEIYQVNGQTSGRVLDTYKEALTAQIAEILGKNGLTLAAAEIEVEDNGKISRLNVLAFYQDKKQEETVILVPTVAPVSLSETEKKKTISPMELYIRETLAEFYQVEENKIIVVIQEET